MDKKDNRIVPLWGGKLNMRDANVVGLSIIFGVVGIILSITIINADNKIVGFVIVLACMAIGYILGRKIFKKAS